MVDPEFAANQFELMLSEGAICPPNGQPRPMSGTSAT